MYKTLRTELNDGILTVYLNRPEKLNTYTHQMSEELISLYQQADNDDNVRVIIVTGEGKAFCAGMDLQEGEETFASKEGSDQFRDSGGKLSLQVYSLKKPIIAAINGPAVGIGLTMTLPMDIRILKRNAKIGFVFARRGIGPEAGSGWFLPRIVGIGKALEWMYTGRYIPDMEALEHGLVHYIDEEPLVKAQNLAKEIVLHTSAISNSFARQLLWRMLGENHPYTSHLAESKFLYWAGNNEDAREGVQSFLEKRDPVFPLKNNHLPDFFTEGGENV